ncbi:transposase [Lysobacter antibioticus]|uniref:transposase n=1 Tax=Lysobacter antibioticus TaxID=84531 RepID=UPI003CCD8D5C
MQYEFTLLESRAHLSDAQWDCIAASLPGNTGTRARQDRQHQYRAFVEAVLWVAINQTFWSELPAQHDSWRSIYARFGRWCDRGMWLYVESALTSSEYGPLLGQLRVQHQQEQLKRRLWRARRAAREADAVG